MRSPVPTSPTSPQFFDDRIANIWQGWRKHSGTTQLGYRRQNPSSGGLVEGRRTCNYSRYKRWTVTTEGLSLHWTDGTHSCKVGMGAAVKSSCKNSVCISIWAISLTYAFWSTLEFSMGSAGCRWSHCTATQNSAMEFKSKDEGSGWGSGVSSRSVILTHEVIVSARRECRKRSAIHFRPSLTFCHSVSLPFMCLFQQKPKMTECAFAACGGGHVVTPRPAKSRHWPCLCLPLRCVTGWPIDSLRITLLTPHASPLFWRWWNTAPRPQRHESPNKACLGLCSSTILITGTTPPKQHQWHWPSWDIWKQLSSFQVLAPFICNIFS